MKISVVIFAHDRPQYLSLILDKISSIISSSSKFIDFFNSIEVIYSNSNSLPLEKLNNIKNIPVNYKESLNTKSSEKITLSFKLALRENIQNHYFLYIDDDCLIDEKRFINFFRKKDFSDKSIYSLYNSFSHRIFKYNKQNNYLEKKSAGMLGLLIPVNIIREYISSTNIFKISPKVCGDSIFVEYFIQKYKKTILVNPISIIQHIGFIGENNNLSKYNVEYSASFLYENESNSMYIELLINQILSRKNYKFNINIWGKINSTIRYRILKKRIFAKSFS
tara:strand:- start:12477 stop:13313 length:837 start_codon:yes stop_codon:yes gene_type:complete